MNWSEVLQKAAGNRVARELLDQFEADGWIAVLPFTAADAAATATLWPVTRPFGLSLADRACIALAQVSGRGVVTADRDWARLDLDIAVFVIR